LGVSLQDKLLVTQQLHRAGATITELNCVRKHLSRFKGGRLAEAIKCPAIAVIISDVIGDPLDVIASGPTVPDPTTFEQALGILEHRCVRSEVPLSVIAHLERGFRGQVLETPKSEFTNVMNLLTGSNIIARLGASIEAQQRGLPATVLRGDLEGEADRAAHAVVERFCRERCPAFIFGGETTVTLGPNPGKGGRNQEFVLAMLNELGEEGMKGVTILCAGTDGEDGPTDAAGAIGTEETLKRAKSLNLNPKDFLDRHDSYHFFEATGGLFKTGLTGTNVMDLGVILLH
jgi:hydroxypyruvate reductase/glycerate 2-kinase